MKATGIPRLVLLYPYIATAHGDAFSVFQHVYDEKKEIVGVRVDPGLVGSGGLQDFSQALAEFIRPLMLNPTRFAKAY
ncbi:MAG: hypothetical protein ACLS3M_00550 [Collinsella sp.]